MTCFSAFLAASSERLNASWAASRSFCACTVSAYLIVLPDTAVSWSSCIASGPKELPGVLIIEIYDIDSSTKNMTKQ